MLHDLRKVVAFLRYKAYSILVCSIGTKSLASIAWRSNVRSNVKLAADLAAAFLPLALAQRSQDTVTVSQVWMLCDCAQSKPLHHSYGKYLLLPERDNWCRLPLIVFGKCSIS